MQSFRPGWSRQEEGDWLMQGHKHHHTQEALSLTLSFKFIFTAGQCLLSGCSSLWHQLSFSIAQIRTVNILHIFASDKIAQLATFYRYIKTWDTSVPLLVATKETVAPTVSVCRSLPSSNAIHLVNLYTRCYVMSRDWGPILNVRACRMWEKWHFPFLPLFSAELILTRDTRPFVSLV